MTNTLITRQPEPGLALADIFQAATITLAGVLALLTVAVTV